jgi:cell division protein FtsW (lipid II flippase)
MEWYIKVIFGIWALAIIICSWGLASLPAENFSHKSTKYFLYAVPVLLIICVPIILIKG